MGKKEYILIRNFAVLFIMGILLDWFFPFRGIVWKVAFVLLSLYVGLFKEKGKLPCEKAVLVFAFFNLLHFFISFLRVTPHISVIGGILFALLSLSLFTCLSQKGVMTEEFFRIIVIIFLIAAVLHFNHSRLMRIEKLGASEDSDVTVNASVVFLMMLPMLFFINNKIQKWSVLLVCIYFIVLSAKRGNILASIIPILLFIRMELKDSKHSFAKTLLVIIAIIGVSIITYNWMTNNFYLMHRIEVTQEGDSNGRDIIYRNCWNAWVNSDNVFTYLFGYGFDGTIKHPQIHKYAHNDWLEILVDYGLLGIFLYLLVFFSFFVQIHRLSDYKSKVILASSVFIWFMKTLYSMGYTEHFLSITMICIGTVLGQYKNSENKDLNLIQDKEN